MTMLVVELGTRIACGACGTLLTQLGAAVVFVEAEAGEGRADQGKFAHRPQFAANKLSVGAADRDFLARLVGAADAVLVSSDLDPDWVAALLPAEGGPIVCDITAFGADGPLAGTRFSDRLVQAVAGLMETTGRPDGAPRAVAAPIVEFTTAIYAAAAIVAASRAPVGGERIDMALYDCAVSALATFLPMHFGGGTPRRLGNRHSMAAPWNAYRAADGWVLICSTADPHWRKICEAIGRPELATAPRTATLNARMTHRDEVDAVIGEWTGGLPVADCVAALGRAGVACGPIVTVADLASEPNLRHRRTVRRIADPAGHLLLLPAPLIRFGGDLPDPVVPAPGSGRAPLEATLAGRSNRPSCPGDVPARLPLAGLRVVEIGQFTTAPLCGRHLAMLGAEVIKLEPPKGDDARLWAPHRDGLSYFFVLTNSGKRSIAVDLRATEGQQFFQELLAGADVLVENMKPGSLSRLGYPLQRLAEINPRLIYCAISGFGADAAYPERPAFDTVVQAMSGLMDLTRDGTLPLKSGISIADICGGELALLATLGALARRDATGQGCNLDISMQDSAAWLTQLSWQTASAQQAGPAPDDRTIACRDGFVAVEQAVPLALIADAAGLSRGEMVARLASAGVVAAPVQTIAEVVAHPQTAARGLIAQAGCIGSAPWPLLRSPLRFAVTPTRLGSPIGDAEPWTPALGAAVAASWSRPGS
jgi:crotonobetainyl-CoA:carnitine CoA-transferase CaiB-like acyl-CoA transferase